MVAGSGRIGSVASLTIDADTDTQKALNWGSTNGSGFQGLSVSTVQCSLVSLQLG